MDYLENQWIGLYEKLRLDYGKKDGCLSGKAAQCIQFRSYGSLIAPHAGHFHCLLVLDRI